MGIQEHRVEKHLQSELRKRGGETIKWESRIIAGLPDQVCFLKGRVFFVEAKTVKGKLSPGQKRMHKRLEDLGSEVYTVYGITGVDKLIKELDNGE